MKRVALMMAGLALLFGLCACATMENSPMWQEQYDLGVRYLSEGNYEEAIIAFTAAIEIDPNHALAYAGRGDTYMAMAEQTQNTTEESLALLESAIVDYEQADALGDTLAKEKLQESRSVLQQMQLAQEVQLRLEELYTLFEKDDVEGAKALMRQDLYKELSSSISEGFCFFGEDSGIGLAVYPNNFYYYGQWENGKRNGQGTWVCAVYEDGSDMESYVYEGAWRNNLPNGKGCIVRNRYPDKIQLEPGHTTSVCTEITGTFSDGLYHGTIYEVWNMNDGGIHQWTPITAVNGIYQVIEYEGDRMIVARDNKSAREATLSDSGKAHAVQGLGIQI